VVFVEVGGAGGGALLIEKEVSFEARRALGIVIYTSFAGELAGEALEGSSCIGIVRPCATTGALQGDGVVVI
jgi:hypothetical protein